MEGKSFNPSLPVSLSLSLSPPTPLHFVSPTSSKPIY